MQLRPPPTVQDSQTALRGDEDGEGFCRRIAGAEPVAAAR
jgi:hypothetical protein